MAKSKKQISIAQVGLGRWGKNLLKNFYNLPDVTVKYVCDESDAVLSTFQKEYSNVKFLKDLEVILKDEDVSAVVIATPAPAHYSVAKLCLENGKHVFIEKPITLSVEHAEDLLKVARKYQKKVMVGHLLLYHPVIAKLKQLIDEGVLGKIYYVYTQRLNLGRVRNTENAMWSLAPHDISIVLHLLGCSPESVAAHGAAFLQKDIEDLTFLNLRFKGGALGHIHVSWLDPTKTRRTIVVGSKKMALFDEVASPHSIRLIDKGVDFKPDAQNFEELIKLRNGATEVLAVTTEQPLKLECQHFVDCIRNGQEPLSNGQNGLDVLKVLTAADISMKNGGKHELL